MKKIFWMILLLGIIDKHVWGSENPSSTESTSHTQLALNQVESRSTEIEYGRQIAYLAYKETPEKQAAFIAQHPKMQELYNNRTAIEGVTGLHNDVRSMCAFVTHKNNTKNEFIIGIRGTKPRSSDWLLDLKISQISMELEEEQDDNRTLGPQSKEFNPTQFATKMVNQLKQTAQYLLSVQDSTKKVATGFKRYADSMIDNIVYDIKRRLIHHCETQPERCYELIKETKVSLYGHSLGGATAQLIAISLKEKLESMILTYAHIHEHKPNLSEIKKQLKGKIKIFSYESPKVFNEEAAQIFDREIGNENHIRTIQKINFPLCSAFAAKAASKLNNALHSITDTFRSVVSTTTNLLRGNESIFDFSMEDCPLNYHSTSRQGPLILFSKDPMIKLPPGQYQETGRECVVWIKEENIEDQKAAGPILHVSVPITDDNLDPRCVE